MLAPPKIEKVEAQRSDQEIRALAKDPLQVCAMGAQPSLPEANTFKRARYAFTEARRTGVSRTGENQPICEIF